MHIFSEEKKKHENFKMAEDKIMQGILDKMHELKPSEAYEAK